MKEPTMLESSARSIAFLGTITLFGVYGDTAWNTARDALRVDELRNEVRQERVRNDSLGEKIDSLESVVEGYKGDEARMHTLMQTVQVVPEELNRDTYQPLIDGYPRSEPLVEALVQTGKEYYETGQAERNGYGIPPIALSLSVMRQECGFKHGITNSRMTTDVEYIKRNLISSVGAGGCAQAMPFRAEEVDAMIPSDYPVYTTPEYEDAWDTWNKIRDLREQKYQIEEWRNTRDLRNTNVERGTAYPNKQLLLRMKRLQNRIDSLKRQIQPVFKEYENDLAWRLAGKTVEEVAQIDRRFTPEGASIFLHNFGGKELDSVDGNVWLFGNKYYSGNPGTKFYTVHYADNVTNVTMRLADEMLRNGRDIIDDVSPSSFRYVSP